METIEQKFIGAIIIKFENNIQVESIIVLRCLDGEEYTLTISNDHKFLITRNFNKVDVDIEKLL